MKLPNRRPAEIETLWFSGRRYHVTVGYDPQSGLPAEAFIAGSKIGSEMDALLDDGMIALSKLLQAGADPHELSATFGQQSIIGAVARLLADKTPSPASGPCAVRHDGAVRAQEAGAVSPEAVPARNRLGLTTPEADRLVPRHPIEET